jgi:hypothetical protein
MMLFQHILKEQVIVAVVDVHSEQQEPLDLEGPLEDWRDLIGGTSSAVAQNNSEVVEARERNGI